MADSFKPVQAQDFKLAGSGISITDTTIILQSFAQIDGTLLTMSNIGTTGYGCLEPGTVREESITFTGVTQNANGTASLTGVTRGVGFVYPYSQDLTLRQGHAGGATFRLSNTSAFYSEFAGKNNDETFSGAIEFTGQVTFNNTIPEMSSYVAPTLDTELAAKKYVDDIAIAGSPDATTTVKGIVEIATQAEVDAGTTTGGTGASLAVRPPELANVIQDGSYVYAADSVGTDSYAITLVPAITAYVTGQVFHFKAGTANTGASTLNVNGLGAKDIKRNYNEDTETGDIIANAINTVVYDGTNFQLISPSNALPSGSVLSQLDKFSSTCLPDGVITLIAGENINGTTTPVVVYQSYSDGKVYKADADFFDERATGAFGFVTSNVSTNQSVNVYTKGILTVPALTLSSTISSTLDQKCISSTSDTIKIFDSTNDKLSMAFQVGNAVGNISSIVININDNTATGDTSNITLFAADPVTGKPTGSVLATSETKISPPTGDVTYTFTTPYEVTPNQMLCFVVNATAITGGSWLIRGGNTNAYEYITRGTTTSQYESSDGGSTWSTAANAIYFKIYTTKQVYTPGSQIYLSTTAGEYTLTRPTYTDVIKPIAELISSTQIRIGQFNNTILSEYRNITASTSSSYIFYINVPNLTNEVIVSLYEDSTGTDYGTEVTLIRGIFTTYKSEEGTTGYTITMEDGILSVSQARGAGVNIYYKATFKK